MDKRVLVVDDDPMMLRLLAKHLTTAGYEVTSAADGKEALRFLLAEGHPIVVTDWMMPEMDGLELCQAIRNAEGIGYVYAIIVTAHSDKERLVAAFDVGADDFLTKPFHQQELVARVNAGFRIVTLEENLARQNREIIKANAEMAILNRKLEQMATTDALTGLANRREAMSRIEEHWATAQRHGQALSFILIDIDHFKHFNDTYGHDIGDLVLREVAHTLKAQLRGGDMVCRVGGEEFLVICPNTPGEDAARVADRLRRSVETNPIRGHSAALAVTISAGVAQMRRATASSGELLKRADDAMYEAKRAGRNRVVTAGVDPARQDSSAHPAP